MMIFNYYCIQINSQLLKHPMPSKWQSQIQKGKKVVKNGIKNEIKAFLNTNPSKSDIRLFWLYIPKGNRIPKNWD